MYRKLRGRIIEKYGTLREFADHVGLTAEQVSRYMRGKVVFNVVTIDRWASLLDIERCEYPEYFFT